MCSNCSQAGSQVRGGMKANCWISETDWVLIRTIKQVCGDQWINRDGRYRLRVVTVSVSLSNSP